MEKSISTVLTITREFDVPPELIWKMWTNPNLFKKWYGPRNYSCPHCEMDLREGGQYRHCMRSPRGKDTWSTGVFKKIKPNEKLVFTMSLSDEEGNVIPPVHLENENRALESEVTVTLEDKEAKTKMTLHHTGIRDEMQKSARTGWNQSFDKLAGSLKRRTQWS